MYKRLVAVSLNAGLAAGVDVALHRRGLLAHLTPPPADARAQLQGLRVRHTSVPASVRPHRSATTWQWIASDYPLTRRVERPVA
jgi:hypothetical protein